MSDVIAHKRQSPRMNRRQVLQVGTLTALGLTLPELLRGRRAAAASPATRSKRCVLVWLDGGPSHLETFSLSQASIRPGQSMKVSYAPPFCQAD
jgi:hypothetical protein